MRAKWILLIVDLFCMAINLVLIVLVHDLLTVINVLAAASCAVAGASVLDTYRGTWPWDNQPKETES